MSFTTLKSKLERQELEYEQALKESARISSLKTEIEVLKFIAKKTYKN